MPGTKISDAAGQAFANAKPFKRSNYEVIVNDPGKYGDGMIAVSLNLHGHRIVSGRVGVKGVQIDTCGYRNPTTMRAINAVLKAIRYPYKVGIKNFEPVLYILFNGDLLPQTFKDGMTIGDGL
jgi:hypothetical protein